MPDIVAKLKKTPIEFNNTLISFFFADLSNPERILSKIETFDRRGFDVSNEFYWMHPELQPTIPELRGILDNPDYGLSVEEKERYLKVYEAHQNSKKDKIA